MLDRADCNVWTLDVHGIDCWHQWWTSSLGCLHPCHDPCWIVLVFLTNAHHSGWSRLVKWFPSRSAWSIFTPYCDCNTRSALLHSLLPYVSWFNDELLHLLQRALALYGSSSSQPARHESKGRIRWQVLITWPPWARRRQRRRLWPSVVNSARKAARVKATVAWIRLLRSKQVGCLKQSDGKIQEYDL